jgi:hypothetical protein
MPLFSKCGCGRRPLPTIVAMAVSRSNFLISKRCFHQSATDPPALHVDLDAAYAQNERYMLSVRVKIGWVHLLMSDTRA